ncbi:MAG: DUF2628 domain-containing protein [Alphaproteobacteria bacterium]|nr:DUF2628 domain-containing protein [Alphaproteobacteria bacterium]
MATYCVFTADRRPLLDDGSVVLVRDRFSWAAAAFGALWALGHRLWFAALGLTGAWLGLAALVTGGVVSPIIGAAGALLTGFHAADLRARGLWDRGYRVDDLVVAPDLDEAERRYLARRRLARVEP